jgi:hypothetical protein
MQDHFKQAESAYRENRTRRFVYRIDQLRRLHAAVVSERLSLLNAAQHDTGKSQTVWQHSHGQVLGIICDEARELASLLDNKRQQALNIVPASTVLIIGTEQGKGTNPNRFRQALPFADL